MPPSIRAFRRLPRFDRALKKLPEERHDQLKELLQDLLLPAIPNGRHVKLMSGIPKRDGDIWEARLDRKFRLTFHMDGDVAVLRNIGPHDILNDP